MSQSFVRMCEMFEVQLPRFNYPEVQLQLPDYSTTLKFSSNDLEYHIPFALYSSIGLDG